MKQEDVLKVINNTTIKDQESIDWNSAWAGKYPILKTYKKEVNTTYYAKHIKILLTKLQNDYNYNELDALLVLKDILANNWKNK